MKYKRHEIKSGKVELPKDPFTGKAMCWIVDMSINEPFEGPDFSRFKSHLIDEHYHDRRKVLHTYKNAGGGIRHRLYDYETSVQIFSDLPMTVDESEWTMPFGKHQGLPLSEIPEDYRRWAAENIKNAQIKEIMKNSLLTE